MPFQQTVYMQQGFGVIGERYSDAPSKVQSYILNSGSVTQTFGTAFSITSEGVANAGNSGSQVFAGILVNPKGSVSVGSGGNPLAPSLVLPNNAQGELATMGDYIVSLPGAASAGDWVYFDNTSGILGTVSPGGSLPSGKTWAQAEVNYYYPTGAGLAVISIQPFATTV